MDVQKTTFAPAVEKRAPVVVLGRAGGLSTAICGALARAGTATLFVGDPVPSPTAEHGRLDLDRVPGAAEAVLVLLEHAAVERIAGERDSWWRRRVNRAREGGVCDVVTEVALRIGGRRVLLLCDARAASLQQRSALIQWVRQLALRIHYECSINGLDGLAVSYEVVVDDAEVQRLATSVLRWQGGGTPGIPNPVAPQ